MPAPTEKIVNEAMAAGQVRYQAARILAAEYSSGQFTINLRPRGGDQSKSESYDVVINCTGIGTGPRGDDLSRSLIEGGWAVPHETGFGWQVDDDSRAVGLEGLSHPSLFIIGPPSAGHFGDPIGAAFIVAQIDRLMPDLLAALDSG